MPTPIEPPAEVSVFRRGENCCAIARAPRAAVLVDGEAYFPAFMRAAERAERSIVILAWDFDSRTPVDFDEAGRPTRTLGEFLNGLAARKRRLRIRILDWDYPMIFGVDREFPPIYGIAWKPHRRIDFRYDDTHPLTGSHHQKIVVIDDKVAFVGGLDLTSRRWDSRDHAPDDPRRTFEGKPYPPFHDTMIAVDGEAAAALAEIARGRWLRATHERLRPVKSRGDPWPAGVEPGFRDVEVGIACTSPPGDGFEPVRHVEALYLDMIARARRYIYIENQYFTSEKVAAALAARLAEPDGPEIVLLTRLLSHGWLEEATMTNLRSRLVHELRAADRHGRFEVYYPHREGLCDGTCIDLHSKLMIVDDEWLRIGSSNLSNRSMAVDTECDLTLEARGDPGVRATIRRCRDDLVAEHTGCTAERVAAAVEAKGGLKAAIAELGTKGRRLARLEVEELPETALTLASVGDIETPISLDRLVQTMTPPGEPPPDPRHGRFVLAGALVLVLALAYLWKFTPLATLATPETAIAWAGALTDHWWAPFVVVLAYTPASVMLLPRWLITLAAVMAFGPWAAFAYALVGVVLAAVVGYLGGRIAHRDTVRRIAGPRVTRLSLVLQRRGLLAVTLVRLVPIAPFIVVNAVMGAMRIRLRHFVGGTVIGMLPGLLATTVLGGQIANFLVDPRAVNPWLVGVGLAALALLGWLGHRWARRRA